MKGQFGLCGHETDGDLAIKRNLKLDKRTNSLPPPLVTELRAVSTVTSSGLRDLLNHRDEANRRGIAVGLVASGTVQRLLQQANLNQTFRPFATPDAALSALGVTGVITAPRPCAV